MTPLPGVALYTGEAGAGLEGTTGLVPVRNSNPLLMPSPSESAPGLLEIPWNCANVLKFYSTLSTATLLRAVPAGPVTVQV